MGGFFLLSDLGPGAAAGGMGIEINTGNSCYLSAARRRRGRFFSPIGSGPRGSGWWNGDRDKHWEQLLFISGPSSPGRFFSPIGSGPRGSGWWNGDHGKYHKTLVEADVGCGTWDCSFIQIQPVSERPSS